MSSIVLPNDVQAEVGLIGSIILHPEFAAQISWFKADYLYHNENKCLYWAITELLKENVENVDDFNIIKKINENPGVKGLFEELKIPSLQVLIDDYKIVARHTLEEYRMLVNRVTTLAYKRRAYDTSIKFSEHCLKDNSYSINELNLKFHNNMSQLAEKFIVNKEVSLIGDVIDDTWNQIEEQRQMGLVGIPSKYSLVNDYFTYQNGELYVVGGRAKAGKSSFFANEIHHKLKLGISVGLLDTEMSLRRLLPRILALESGLTIKEIERGNYKGNASKERRLKHALDWWKKQKFVHLYEPSWTFDKIYATAKLLKIRKDFDLNFLVFDYIKMTNASDTNGEKRNYFLGTFTNFLKNNVAGELDIPVIAGAQMSPYEIRLADSDEINRYASVVSYWMLKTKDDYTKEQGIPNTGNYKFVVDYNRLGKNHNRDDGERINFQFDKDRCLIEQAKFQPAEEDQPEETEFNIYAESN